LCGQDLAEVKLTIVKLTVVTFVVKSESTRAKETKNKTHDPCAAIFQEAEEVTEGKTCRLLLSLVPGTGLGWWFEEDRSTS
jgi:hypothetical protein